jgi:hypothetical protein
MLWLSEEKILVMLEDEEDVKKERRSSCPYPWKRRLKPHFLAFQEKSIILHQLFFFSWIKYTHIWGCYFRFDYIFFSYSRCFCTEGERFIFIISFGSLFINFRNGPWTVIGITSLLSLFLHVSSDVEVHWINRCITVTVISVSDDCCLEWKGIKSTERELYWKGIQRRNLTEKEPWSRLSSKNQNLQFPSHFSSNRFWNGLESEHSNRTVDHLLRIVLQCLFNFCICSHFSYYLTAFFSNEIQINGKQKHGEARHFSLIQILSKSQLEVKVLSYNNYHSVSHVKIVAESCGVATTILTGRGMNSHK